MAIGSKMKGFVGRLPGARRSFRRMKELRRRYLGRAGRSHRPADSSPTRRPPRLVIVTSRADVKRVEALASELRYCRVVPEDRLALDEADYLYAPRDPGSVLSANQLRNVYLCIAQCAYDFVVVSAGLEESPRLVIASSFDNAVLSRRAFEAIRAGGRLPVGARGRVLRLVEDSLPARQEAAASLDDLGWGELCHASSELWVPEAGGGAPAGPPTRRPMEPLLDPAVGDGDSHRPLVLVISIFMAVGGVERNLIEVMRRLESRYRFVVVTTERVSEERGSLNHQAISSGAALFDLGELAPQSHHLELLELLAESYRPDLVFITNGSPWLLDSAASLRRSFASLPIVDQQVYDTREGWIEHYGDPGIQSFDRFIAINDAIRAEFLGRYRMDERRIDLIYHAVDDDRFNLERAERVHADPGGDFLDLHGNGLLVAQVGRLTRQKRPLDFLELARRVQELELPVRFLLVGDGELAADCDEFISEQRLANLRRIPFCDDMARLLPFVDGMVVTSQYEGLPVVVLEALSMGIPILSTDVGDVRSVLEEYGVGMVLEEIGDPERLLRSFLSWRTALPDLRLRARAAAPSISERFSAGAVAAQYDQSWQRAMKEHVDG